MTTRDPPAPPTPARPALPWRALVLIWLGWYVALLVFQQVAWARFTLDRPDYAYPWTGDMTPGYADGPDTGPWFYARWDSPRYVQIAREGYTEQRLAPHFPLYPALMRIVFEALIRPLGLADWDTGEPHAGMALAGLIVSGGMSLVAVLAMAALLWEWATSEDAIRAAFYLLIFPTAFFLAQVYSEATYMAASLAALLFISRRRWLPALVLVLLATMTRTMGVLLVIPYLFTWFNEWWDGRQPPRWPLIGAVLPPVVFAGWAVWLDGQGMSMFAVQEEFGREVLTLRSLLVFLGDVIYIFREPNGIHVALDLALTGLAVSLCLVEIKRFPGMALYGLGSVAMGISSGQLVSMNRYTLAVVPVFFVLARWGRRPIFDKLWTIISLLWFTFYTVLYVHGFWVG
ncbi:MAG: hypothetical protein JXJ20_02380 [Anaerolineae bacterium]|nr:hypothetical protein [Anaerolineae bacterium]